VTWRLAGSLASLSFEVRLRWPGTTIWTIGDASHSSRASDHNPNDANVVCAVDIVGFTQAKAVADHLAARKDPRLAYMIFDRRIMSGPAGPSPWVWRPYSKDPHSRHVHVSVGRGPDGGKTRSDLYDNSTTWGLTAREDEDVEALKAFIKSIQEEINGAGFRDRDGNPLVANGVWDAKSAYAFRNMARTAMRADALRTGGALTQESADARYARKGASITLKLP
jgi:hypothetical protein